MSSIQLQGPSSSISNCAVLVDEALVCNNAANDRVCVPGIPARSESARHRAVAFEYLQSSYGDTEPGAIQTPELPDALRPSQGSECRNGRNIVWDARVSLLHLH